MSRLQKYAKIYNRQHHVSLGTSPFHVYYGRLPYHGNEAIAVNNPTADVTAPVAKRPNNASSLRATASIISDKCRAKMTRKQLHKYLTSCYRWSRAQTIQVWTGIFFRTMIKTIKHIGHKTSISVGRLAVAQNVYLSRPETCYFRT